MESLHTFPLKISLLLLLIILPTTSLVAASSTHHTSSNHRNVIGVDYGIRALNRSTFPANFLFGTASAAYQYEGAADEDGRGPSIWDAYTHKYPEKMADRSNGDVAIDFYHRYKEDVKIMKEMKLDAYRLSISWPRILPHGKLSMGVNRKGLQYYHNLIDELLSNGIKPFVTLFHWDLPQSLEVAYGGFLSPKVVDNFRDYVDLCFREFGDKVKHWITLNEPSTYASGGYAYATLAPGRCSAWQNLNCTGGDSATEPYLVAHNLLLSHSVAVHLYRNKYQASQKGMIGITITTNWMVPYSKTKEDSIAASKALDFLFGWFMDPITFGEYPHSMRSLVGNRLPVFTKEQSRMLKGSYDFLGLNYYTAYYATGYHGYRTAKNFSYINDALVNQTRISEANSDDKLSLKEQLNDTKRINFYHSHLAFLHLAIKHGVDVRGFFAWSLLDNFEWTAGFTVRFGINYVDYKNGLKRYPKLSAQWFKNFLHKKF